MSLMGSLRTGVAGMNAQSFRIGAVAENIANASTSGFKKKDVVFETVLGSLGEGRYATGSVASHVRYAIESQGPLNPTSNPHDLAIDGQGFFVVSDSNGQQFLTRAGAFVPDSSGRLVNAAGMYLMGYGAGGATEVEGQPEIIKLPTRVLSASPSTDGVFTVNLPASAGVIAQEKLPSANSGQSTGSVKSSLIAFDRIGDRVDIDLYFSRTGPNDWELSAFEHSEAVEGGFPYASGPLFTQDLSFNQYGKLVGPGVASFEVPGGERVNLDLSKSSVLATSFTVLEQGINGGPPAEALGFEVGPDGVMSTVFDDGRKTEAYRIALGDVASPSQLSPVSGNAYTSNDRSGAVTLGLASRDGFGAIISSTLEASNVDIAEELTTMIEAQRNFTANSRVLQTSSELLDVLNRI